MIIEQINLLCKERNEKISGVLRKLGISPSITASWKKTNEIKSSTLIKLAEYFNVSTDYILGREEKPIEKKSINQSISGIALYSPQNIGQLEEQQGIPKQVSNLMKDLSLSDQAKILSYTYELLEKKTV